MPGLHVDKAYDHALNELTAEKPSDIELAKLGNDERAAIKKKHEFAYGTEIFTLIENDATLNATERQEVYQKLAAQFVKNGIEKSPDPATLLRGNTKETNFMTAFMNEYASDYFKAVNERTVKAISNIDFPDDPNLKSDTLPQPGADPNDPLFLGSDKALKPSTIQFFNDAYAKASMQSLDASIAEMEKLSPEARQFLKSMSDTALAEGGDNRTVSTLMANTLQLRGTSSNAFKEGARLMNDPNGSSKQKMQGAFLVKANVPMQSFLNFAHSDTYASTKNEAGIVQNMRTPENLAMTRAGYAAASSGDPAKISEAAQNLKRVGELEKKIRALSKPISWERFKAFFNGGADKVKQETQNKLTNVRADILQKADSLPKSNKLDSNDTDKVLANTLRNSQINSVDNLKVSQDRINVGSNSGVGIDNLAKGTFQKNLDNVPVNQIDQPINIDPSIAIDKLAKGQFGNEPQTLNKPGVNQLDLEKGGINQLPNKEDHQIENDELNAANLDLGGEEFVLKNVDENQVGPKEKLPTHKPTVAEITGIQHGDQKPKVDINKGVHLNH